MNRSEEILKNGSFGKLLINLSLPAIIVIIIMIIYNVADTFFIGQTGDPNKIAAISLSMPIFTILSGIGTLFGNGGTTSISFIFYLKNTSVYSYYTSLCGFCTVKYNILNSKNFQSLTPIPNIRHKRSVISSGDSLQPYKTHRLTVAVNPVLKNS